jgi:GntR family transcriptional regulator/MocR family aminotransferase
MISAGFDKSSQSSSSAALAALSLNRGTGEPLYGQLASELKRLILARVLPPGSKLPGSRSFAEELGVSRATIVQAFDELVAEGYADSRQGSGLYIASELPDAGHHAAAQPVSAAPRIGPPAALLLRPAMPEVRLFPHELWAKLMQRTWRAPEDGLLVPPDPAGWPPLRSAIASHLGAFRSMQVGPEQVMITSGANESMEVIAAALLSRGDQVFVEEPGYPSMWHTLADLGLETAHIPVDDEGFDIGRASGRAKAALVTPSRHYPLGVTMPLARRLALLEWARSEAGWIIEDDYDSEYRYRGRPLPALMNLDDGERVIYIGSFSKTILPGLRLGFLVVPAVLADRFHGTIARRGPRAALMMQPVLARFIAEGHYGTHIRRMRRLYAKRQAVLLEALRRYADGILSANPESGGMHIICRLMNGMDDCEAAARAATAGIAASALSGYFAGPPTRQGLLLGYAGFDEPAIDGAIRRLVTVLKC